jgi:hypothetical protein
MNAVRPYDRIGLNGATVGEPHFNAVAPSVEIHALSVDDNRFRITVAYRIKQDRVQVSAVDVEVGKAIPLDPRAADRYFTDDVTRAAVSHSQEPRQEANGCKRFAQAERFEYASCIGADLDACPNLAERGRALKDFYANTVALESQRRRQAANTGTNDCNLHR